jgi:hypothetical protein
VTPKNVAPIQTADNKPYAKEDNAKPTKPPPKNANKIAIVHKEKRASNKHAKRQRHAKKEKESLATVVQTKHLGLGHVQQASAFASWENGQPAHKKFYPSQRCAKTNKTTTVMAK